MYQKLSITEQVPGAPLSDLLQLDGDTTDDFGDIHIGAKVKLVTETARRPAIGSWFSTRLPNAGNESGLGKDVQDFSSALSIGKTVQSVRVVANIGVLMIGKPTEAAAQDDLLIYSLSVARAISPPPRSSASLSAAPTSRTSSRRAPRIAACCGSARATR